MVPIVEFAFSQIGLLFSFHPMQYVNRSAAAVRSALKEPAKSKLAAQNQFSYKVSAWEGGKQGVKTEIHSLANAGAKP